MTALESKLNRWVENGRTRRSEDDPNEPYLAYDLTTAKEGDVLTLVTTDSANREKKEVFDLIKMETPKGASALEGWTLVTEMGKVTVRLSLSGRVKGGGATAQHHRVVLRHGLELGVSARILNEVDPDLVLDKRAAMATAHNMGVIAVIMDGLNVDKDLEEDLSAGLQADVVRYLQDK